MPVTDLADAGERFVADPAFAPPPMGEIHRRVEQRRRRRRVGFGAGLASLTLAGVGLVATSGVGGDEPVTAVAATDVAGGDAEAAAPTHSPGDSDASAAPRWFGGDLDVAIERFARDDDVVAEAAGAADETYELNDVGSLGDVTVHVDRGAGTDGDRTVITIVAEDEVIRVGLPADVAPDEDAVRRFVDSGRGQNRRERVDRYDRLVRNRPR